MRILTEPIGSIPRPAALREGLKAFSAGHIDAKIESPEEIRDLILEAAEYISPSQLGTTDDCGFSPFADDDSTSREIAFAKIRARVEGTKLAEQALERRQYALQK